MRVNILDPGLLVTAGHHLEYDLRVVQELTDRGHETTVYSHVQISEQARQAVSAITHLAPIFRVSPYANPNPYDPVSGELASFLDGALMLAEDLTLINEADIWMWPSIFAAQLHACVLAKPNLAISGCIHVEPTFMAPNGRMWWRYALLKARNVNLRVNLGVMGPDLEREYSLLTSDGRINRFPIAHDGAPIHVRKTELRRIGFFGHQRLEKGAGLLPVLIPRLLHEGYEVVLHDSGELVRADATPGLTILGYVPSLAEEIAKCDLIVVPYDPVAYRAKGSGVVWEAIASGVPVIAPAGTAMGSLVHSTGTGTVFASLNQDEVYRSILEARRDYQQFSNAAFDVSQGWRTEHGIKPFVSMMLGNMRTAASA